LNVTNRAKIASGSTRTPRQIERSLKSKVLKVTATKPRHIDLSQSAKRPRMVGQPRQQPPPEDGGAGVNGWPINRVRDRMMTPVVMSAKCHEPTWAGTTTLKPISRSPRRSAHLGDDAAWPSLALASRSDDHEANRVDSKCQPHRSVHPVSRRYRVGVGGGCHFHRCCSRCWISQE
jgi:hypothetical protein